MSDAPDNTRGELVFVYGTLRRGASGHSRIEGAERVSAAMLRGRLVKIGWFPALVIDPDAKTWVCGDVFRVRGPQLEAFREYEGLAAGAAEGQDCRLAESRVLPNPIFEGCWDVKLWEWTGPLADAEHIPSGDWLDVERPRCAPVLTLVACVCAAAMPLELTVAYLQRVNQLLGMTLMGMAVLSPFAGWLATILAFRRRERREGLLLLAAKALLVEIMVALLFLFVGATELIDYLS